ncbi:TIGR03364 family FAD-dependent oxidoreductase [Curtobacterium sp. 22159]|uniref:TIGR03364 family FAD-dependent oxidoreductase n=1 Tax=Curtobacterium sp. 22159 TaxID=3453882 RepID=UPI003F87CB48
MFKPSHYDVAIVGAGIVGLAHAWEAHRRGLRTVVVDATAGVHGASVRNFGHACITPQTGAAAVFAAEARTRWLDLAARAGFTARQTGTVVVARRPEELAVLEEHDAQHGGTQLLTAAETTDRVPVASGEVVGGAFLPADLQVDPRTAAPAIARHLAEQGVDFRWRTTATGATSGMLGTTRGDITAPVIVVATNHDLDRLFPAVAERVHLLRCRLHMLRATPVLRAPLTVPLLTGWSLLRYSGFAEQPSAAALRDRLTADLPEGIELDLNQMVTQHADGSLILGDTHERAVDAVPFQSERGFDLVVRETRRLFGVREVPVVERWKGVYASSPDREFVIEQPEPGVHVVTVASGIGMTTGLGIAPATFDGTASDIVAGRTPTETTQETR